MTAAEQMAAALAQLNRIDSAMAATDPRNTPPRKDSR